MSRLRALWARLRNLISPPASSMPVRSSVRASQPHCPVKTGGEILVQRHSVPASARVAARSLADVARIGRPAETTAITFQRARIGRAMSWVCGFCSEVIIPAGHPGAAYLLAEHRRHHRRLGDI